jgi:hypothetical protein
MTLSEHERHQLDDIERWLTHDDPVLAHDLRAPLPTRRSWRVIVSAIMLIGGITLLIVGSVLAVPPVLIIGSFASMLFPVPMQLDIHLRHRDQS